LNKPIEQGLTASSIERDSKMDNTEPLVLSATLNYDKLTGLVDEFHIESHQPKAMCGEPHLHLMLEVNYLIGCEMTYQFGENEVILPANRFCIFWGILPHKVVNVTGEGHVVNAYFPLKELIEFGHSESVTMRLMAGEVLVAKHSTDADLELVRRWVKHRCVSYEEWRAIHRKELQVRLMRMFVEGFTTVFHHHPTDVAPMSHRADNTALARALQFIHLSFGWKLTVDAIADEVSLSRSQLAKLFKNTIGIHPKAYLTSLRIRHAKTLLSETRKSVLCIMGESGFETTSAFYDAFKRETDMSPVQYRKYAGSDLD